MYFKRVERQPFALFLSPDLNLDALALRGSKHDMPVRLGYLHLHAFTVSLLLSVGCADTSHTFLVLVSREHEVERCNVERHGDIAIIGEDVWQALCLF